MLEESAVIRFTESGRTAVPLEVPDAETLIDLGVSLDQRAAAAVEPDRTALWILPLDRSITEQRVPGTQVGGASFDVDGQAWFTDSGRVLRVAPTGVPEEVPVQPALAEPIASVHLARDGARVVLVADGVLHLGVIQQATLRARDRVGAPDRHDRVRGPGRRLAQLGHPRCPRPDRHEQLPGPADRGGHG